MRVTEVRAHGIHLEDPGAGLWVQRAAQGAGSLFLCKSNDTLSCDLSQSRESMTLAKNQQLFLLLRLVFQL